MLEKIGIDRRPLVMEIADLKIDTGQNAVWKEGIRVPLTQREYALLVLLVKNSGRALSRAVIKETIWADRELYRDSRTIDVHVQHLRAKIEDDPATPKHIVTIPGTGYIFYE